MALTGKAKRLRPDLWEPPSWKNAPATVDDSYQELQRLATQYRVGPDDANINCTNFACGKYRFPEDTDFYLRLIALLMRCQQPRTLALAEISHPQTPRFYIDLDFELEHGATDCPPELLHSSGSTLDKDCLIAFVHSCVQELAGEGRARRAHLLHAVGRCGLKHVFKPSFRLVYADLTLSKSTALQLLLEVQNRCVRNYRRDSLLGNSLYKALDKGVYDKKRPMRLLFSDKAKREKCKTCQALSKQTVSPCFTRGCRITWAGRPLLPLGVLDGLVLHKRQLSWPDFVLGCSTHYGLDLARWQDPPDIAARLGALASCRMWAIPGSPSSAAPLDEHELWSKVYVRHYPTQAQKPPQARTSSCRDMATYVRVAWGDHCPQIRCSQALTNAARSHFDESDARRLLHWLLLPYLGRDTDSTELLDWAKAKTGARGADGVATWFGVSGIRGLCICPFKSTSQLLYTHRSNPVSVTVGASCLHLRCLDDECLDISKRFRIALPASVRPGLRPLLT